MSANVTNVDKCSDILDDDDQEALEDDLDMTTQSHAAKKNQKWKQAQSEAWLADKALRRAEREIMEPEEEKFWLDVIDKYLSPFSIDSKEQERLRAGLLDLRNKVTSGFFMLNLVFIIVVLVLQLQKDCLHIEWPIGPKFNHTVRPCHGDNKEEIWVVTRLQLEPIGLVFLIFFMSILVIQFCAMLCHRFGTLAHIIASTELFCFRKPIDKLTEDELFTQNAVEIARELQAIRGIDEKEGEDPPEDRGISRRRVVQNLESSRRSMMKRKTETLDAAFKKRFFALSSEAGNQETGLSSRDTGRRLTLRKGTIRALEQRRNSQFGSTIDKKRGNPYASDADDAEEGRTRAPAQRKLERLFNQQVQPENSAQKRPQQVWDKPVEDSRRF